MLRVILLLILVLVFDFVLLLVAGMLTLEMNMPQVMHAMEAREINCSRETQKALDDALVRTEAARFKVKAWSGAVIALVTTSGFFVAGRWFKRHRKKVATLSPGDTISHT